MCLDKNGDQTVDEYSRTGRQMVLKERVFVLGERLLRDLMIIYSVDKDLVI